MSLSRLLLALPLAVFCFSTNVSAQGVHDAALDKNKQHVITESGDCVRTKWDSKDDPCGTKQAAPAAKNMPTPKPVVDVKKLGLEQRTIYFNFDSAALTKEGKAKLDAMAASIQASKEVTKASVIGYTDAIGENEYNAKLSQRRADAVRSYLGSRVKVPTDATVKGAGESTTAKCPESMSRDDRIKCMAADRKVEVELSFR